MAHVTHMPNCCGMRELVGASEATNLIRAERVIADIANPTHRRNYCIVTFNGLRSYTGRLATVIKRNNLGAVVGLPEAARNPNSGNIITAYLWTPDWAALDKWQEARRAKVQGS
jgi:hypothetical protein